MRKERELILEEPDAQKRADLLALAVTIASRYFDRAFLWRFFREELEQMREATFVEEWVQEGIERGLQQGLRQGEVEGTRHTHRQNTLQILRARFNLSRQELEPLAEQLETIDDLDELRELFNHALLDVTAADFGARLSRMGNGRQS
ncbi:MAG: hypothetical protein ISS49_16590 [Anaerolineae bacterium]|nr:hypothetical protein [Anaerolineae bacterium]